MKDFRLQAVIPIIFYHGTTSWNKKSFEEYFEGMDNFLLQFLPRFDYHLVDMKNYSNKEIENLFEDKQLQISLLLMKNIFYETSLLNLTRQIFSTSIDLPNKEYENQFYEVITSYIYYSTDINIQKFIEIMETLRTQQSENFVSTAMQLKISGRKEGRKEGRREGEIKKTIKVAYTLINEGFDNFMIRKITELNFVQIDYLRTHENTDVDVLYNL